MPLDLLKVSLTSLEIELNQLKEYIQENSTHIEEAQMQVHRAWTTQSRYGLFEDSDFESKQFEELYFLLHHKYPAFSFNSLLVTEFSLLETHMKQLCDLYGRYNFSKVTLSDLAGSDFEKCWKYFTKVAELDMTDLHETWRFIRTIQKMRNAIVHSSARIENEDEDLLRFVKQNFRIEFKEHDKAFFIGNPDFLMDFAETTMNFLEAIVKKLAAKRDDNWSTN